LILGFEVVFASIAAILGILSFKTLRAISHLGVGKSFWLPVFVSSVIFLAGSVTTILYEAGFSLITQTVEVVQVSRILALCILVCGIYSYSRKVKGSLKEEFSIPAQLFKEQSNLESPDEGNLALQNPATEEIVHEGRIGKGSQNETTPECKHRFGHLRTLPKNASIPDECLGCDRIIECKHSLVETVENRADTASAHYYLKPS
jgi:hypothetical protein